MKLIRVPRPARMLSLLILTALAATAPAETFVGPNGTPDNDGTAAAPMDLDSALKTASKQLKTGGLPKDGITITLLGGVYRFTKGLELGPEFAGSEENPITIQAAAGAEVVFDGRANVANPEAFAPVTDPAERARLAAAARDQIVVKTIQDPAIIGTLNSKIVLSLGIDDALYLPAVYPNEGYANLNTKPTVDESFPPGIPKKKQAYGVRAGHPPFRDLSMPQGWRGSLEDPRGAQAGIATRADEMAGTWEQWAAELDRDNTRHDFSGYYEAIWKLTSSKIHSVNADAKTLRLAEAFSYGFGWLKSQPFRVFGLLCELDQPGEWYFDTQTNRLYLYPVAPLTADSRVGLPVANGFLKLTNTKHVRIVGINVRNVGRGTVIEINGGARNLLAGSTIENSTATGVTISGEYNEVRGCDFIDLNKHVVLAGGVRSATEITAGHNLVENCHFYHKRFTHEKVNIVMEGVGNTFRNNLIHNSIGQAMIIYGNGHTLELNELFNIGYEEGDGGALYAGADLAGYGVVYRHNFIHHLMRTPNKKLGRNGIFIDDHQSGATCIGNIFFKSCDNGICMNGGAGNTLIGNLFLEGLTGIFNRGNWGAKAYRITSEIAEDPNHDYVGMKEDYIGRVEAELGQEAWMKEPWASTYPLFKKVMSDTGELGRCWPIHCTYKDNMYFGNKRNETYLYRYGSELKKKHVLENDLLVDKSYFADYDAMDFTFVKTPPGVEAIPFAKIGLYLDEYREEMPDKAYYRTAIQQYFDGLPSYKACPKTIDTSKLIEEGPKTTQP